MKRKTAIITTSIAAAAVALGAGAAYAVAADDDSLDSTDMQRARDAALAETGGGTVTEVESDDGGYDVEVRLDDGTEIDIELAGDFTIRSTEADQPDDNDDDDADDDADDAPLDETSRQRATDAALAAAGGGTVTDVERDASGFDVEVRLDDGTELDIDLASDFSVVHQETDD